MCWAEKFSVELNLKGRYIKRNPSAIILHKLHLTQYNPQWSICNKTIANQTRLFFSYFMSMTFYIFFRYKLNVSHIYFHLFIPYVTINYLYSFISYKIFIYLIKYDILCFYYWPIRFFYDYFFLIYCLKTIYSFFFLSPTLPLSLSLSLSLSYF